MGNGILILLETGSEILNSEFRILMRGILNSQILNPTVKILNHDIIILKLKMDILNPDVKDSEP